jgi:hypothetical protein
MCTMISRQPIDGIELRVMLPSMLLFATHVRESKPSINDPEATSAPPRTRNGSSTPTQAHQNYAQGRVNQMSVEEAQNIPNVVPGTS